MIHFRFLFHTLVTVPPFPAPISESTSRSSSLTRSNPCLSFGTAFFALFPFSLSIPLELFFLVVALLEESDVS